MQHHPWYYTGIQPSCEMATMTSIVWIYFERKRKILDTFQCMKRKTGTSLSYTSHTTDPSLETFDSWFHIPFPLWHMNWVTCCCCSFAHVCVSTRTCWPLDATAGHLFIFKAFSLHKYYACITCMHSFFEGTIRNKERNVFSCETKRISLITSPLLCSCLTVIHFKSRRKLSFSPFHFMWKKYFKTRFTHTSCGVHLLIQSSCKTFCMTSAGRRSHFRAGELLNPWTTSSRSHGCEWRLPEVFQHHTPWHEYLCDSKNRCTGNDGHCINDRESHTSDTWSFSRSDHHTIASFWSSRRTQVNWNTF